MSAFALISGRLWKAAEAKTTKTGLPFAVATVRVGERDRAVWWSVVAFGEVGQDLLRLEGGDSVSLSGPFLSEIYVDKTGEPRVSHKLTADRLATPKIGRALGRDADGDPIASLVVREVEGTPKAAANASKPKKLTPAAQIALKALHDAISDFGETPPTSNHIPHSTKTVSVDKWRERAFAMGVSTGEDRAQRAAFQRGTEALIASGKAAIWDSHAWPV